MAEMSAIEERQFEQLDEALHTSPILSASRNCRIDGGGGSIGDVCTLLDVGLAMQAELEAGSELTGKGMQA